ncbi:hypothetical protein KGM_207740 [Danaus plexippus plexippus]|uniref:Uncharacterized protein n=1 Tax=Danaus plexippus plexippus TaxID=278856 RepID=A0A212FL93_DANPL|nr:hypothetical protein KGM_207740 [Danaus plexippus plexippus]
MSEAFFDEYDYYNFEYDKHIFSSHSGKQRTKKEDVMADTRRKNGSLVSEISGTAQKVSVEPLFLLCTLQRKVSSERFTS